IDGLKRLYSQGELTLTGRCRELAEPRPWKRLLAALRDKEWVVYAKEPQDSEHILKYQQRIAFGERAGQRVRRIGSGFGYEGERPTLSGPRCASVHGFSLHANTHVPAPRREQLEGLIRCTARGAVSLERLNQETTGDLLYSFTRPGSDGTTGIKLSPLERLEKWAAWVSPPRMHPVRYAGCLAAPRKLRGAITPTPRQQGIETPASPVSSRFGWARLLKRVFSIDMERCPRCQSGALRLISAIT
ncbi:MAG: transposase, partial [Candidatus Tectomicrobia bacterium]|nr:transposase [Candidatus Tectomicrobia bacterium]